MRTDVRQENARIKGTCLRDACTSPLGSSTFHSSSSTWTSRLPPPGMLKSTTGNRLSAFKADERKRYQLPSLERRRRKRRGLTWKLDLALPLAAAAAPIDEAAASVSFASASSPRLRALYSAVVRNAVILPMEPFTTRSKRTSDVSTRRRVLGGEDLTSLVHVLGEHDLRVDLKDDDPLRHGIREELLSVRFLDRAA